jgi:uncharacterized damage-inducible protein DinB
MADRVEAWLRGPVPGVPPLLQPAAHALVQAREELEAVAGGLAPDELWHAPDGVASVGYHLRHLAGALDRLLTYARNEPLSETQRAALVAERQRPDPLPTAAALLSEVGAAIDRALEQLRSTPESALLEPRFVGRARLPSTVLGLIFHAAEHTARHAGQVVTTVKMQRGRAAS